MVSLTSHANSTEETDLGIALRAASVVQVSNLELFVVLVVLMQHVLKRELQTLPYVVQLSHLTKDNYFRLMSIHLGKN